MLHLLNFNVCTPILMFSLTRCSKLFEKVAHLTCEQKAETVLAPNNTWNHVLHFCKVTPISVGCIFWNLKRPKLSKLQLCLSQVAAKWAKTDFKGSWNSRILGVLPKRCYTHAENNFNTLLCSTKVFSLEVWEKIAFRARN